MILAILTACAAPCPDTRRAGLQHVVLVELKDPAEAAEMMLDMAQAFAAIPELRGWDAGPHVDTGRPAVQRWYTVGIVTDFASVTDYRAYLVHPRHVALVEKWKSRWKRSEMFDFGEPAE